MRASFSGSFRPAKNCVGPGAGKPESKMRTETNISKELKFILVLG